MQSAVPWHGRSTPPPFDSRTWIHPSELPSFEALTRSNHEPVRTRAVRMTASALLVALLIGGAGLASTNSSNPINQPMSRHVTSTIGGLPDYTRWAAARTVDLTITTPGHVTHVPAMVLANNLAVTTTPIGRNALLTASIPRHINFAVTWIGRDESMGFTIVRLGIQVPALSFAPLPASTSVVAIAPVGIGSLGAPHFAWANTTLGDPILRANGVVSYLATAPDQNLNGFVDAIAVNAAGKVVAVLSTDHLWYSAQFVARVATIVATGHGCHSSLDLKGSSAQGGGVQVRAVEAPGASLGHLRAGDIVIAVNAHDIDSWNTLLTVLYLTPALTNVRITYLRHASKFSTVVSLACAL